VLPDKTIELLSMFTSTFNRILRHNGWKSNYIRPIFNLTFNLDTLFSLHVKPDHTFQEKTLSIEIRIAFILMPMTNKWNSDTRIVVNLIKCTQSISQELL